MTRRPRLDYQWRGVTYRVWLTTPHAWRLMGIIVCATGVLVLLLALADGAKHADSAAAAFGVLFLIAGVPLTWLAGRQVRRWDERERRRSAGVQRL